MPLAQHKCEGPAMKLTFFGIEIDLVAGSLRLPLEKIGKASSHHTGLGYQEWVYTQAAGIPGGLNN